MPMELLSVYAYAVLIRILSVNKSNVDNCYVRELLATNEQGTLYDAGPLG